MSSNHTIIETEKTFTKEEFEKIKTPLETASMDDKWTSIFENNTLKLYRSWTGFCIYEVYFSELTAYKVVINNNKDQWKSYDDDYNLLLVAFIVNCLIIGNASRFPIRKEDYDKYESGLFQHHLTGTSYPECVISFSGEEK